MMEQNVQEHLLANNSRKNQPEQEVTNMDSSSNLQQKQHQEQQPAEEAPAEQPTTPITDDANSSDTLTTTAAADNDNNDNDDNDDDKPSNNFYTKLAVTIFLLGFVIFVIVDSATNQYVKTGIDSFLEWMEDHPTKGFFAFVLVCFTTTILFIPGILLTIGAGFVFSDTFGLGVGIVMATLAVFLGASAGAIVSFLLGRFLLRDCIAGLSKKFTLLEALDNAFEEKGLQIMALLRLSPLIYISPYLNYGMGGSAISFKDYCIAMLAILPATVLFVFLGASAGSLADTGNNNDNSPASKIVVILGIVVSVIAVACTSYYARQELNKLAAAAAAANNNTPRDEENEQGGGGAAEPGTMAETEMVYCAENNDNGMEDTIAKEKEDPVASVV